MPDLKSVLTMQAEAEVIPGPGEDTEEKETD